VVVKAPTAFQDAQTMVVDIAAQEEATVDFIGHLEIQDLTEEVRQRLRVRHGERYMAEPQWPNPAKLPSTHLRRAPDSREDLKGEAVRSVERDSLADPESLVDLEADLERNAALLEAITKILKRLIAGSLQPDAGHSGLFGFFVM
jgi:hypothetical protein